MEHDSSSDKKYKQRLAETFDCCHETSDHTLSGSNALTELSGLNLPRDSDIREPHIGMESESGKEARGFYEMHGRRVGFTIRSNRTRRSLKGNSIIAREFVCSKRRIRPEKYRRRESGLMPSQLATRECNAILRIAARDGGKWLVHGFVKEHNHELKPSNFPPRRRQHVYSCKELSLELQRGRKKSAAYREQLQSVLKYLEEYIQTASLKVELVTNNLKELKYGKQETSS